MAIAATTGVSLEIAPEALAAAIAAAEQAWPREACGFLLGPGANSAQVDRFLEIQNVQDELHREDPARHARTAHTGYTFEPRALLDLVMDETAPVAAKVAFHSHPDGCAELSSLDRDRAFLQEGLLTYPVQHLVIAVRDGRACEARLFDLDQAGDRLVCTRTLNLLSESR